MSLIKKIYLIISNKDKTVIAVTLLTSVLIYIILWLFYDSKVISFLIAIYASFILLEKVEKIITIRNKEKLTREFLELLKTVLIGMDSGQTFLEALKYAHSLLKNTNRHSNILNKELEIVFAKTKNNFNFSDALMEFSKSLDVGYITDFCEVYRLASNRSNDIDSIIIKNISLLDDSFKMKSEVDSILIGKKLEVVLLCVFPPILMLFFRFFYPHFCHYLYSSMLGRITVTISLSIFVFSGYIAQRIIKDTYDY